MMLKDLRCGCAYFGHFEGRPLFGETDENINKKVMATLRNNIILLLFVCEAIEELQRGLTEGVLKFQIKTCLKDVSAESFKKIIIY